MEFLLPRSAPSGPPPTPSVTLLSGCLYEPCAKLAPRFPALAELFRGKILLFSRRQPGMPEKGVNIELERRESLTPEGGIR